MNRIKELRERKGLNMKEAAALLNMPYTTYVNYEKGLREPTSEVLILIADFFETSVDHLIGRDGAILEGVSNILPLPESRSYPLIGTIACGEPILAEENISEYIQFPGDIDADFCLRCKGDSMINARIYDGDIVFIRKQDQVETGEIAAVRIGDEATLKRVYYIPGSDRVTLRACNPLYPDMEFEGDTLNDMQIIGKAVNFLSSVR